MNLIENGQDSFKKAIRSLNDLNKNSLSELEYECKLKDIVINLHHSIETLFKHMVKEKNEFLLYSNCEEIFQARALKKINYKNVQEKTIQFLDAIHRVIVLYDIDIKKENYNNLKRLNNIRNYLTHYEKNFSDNEIEHLIAVILPFLIEVYSNNINGFKDWAKTNNIYKDTENINQNNEVWVIDRYVTLDQKIVIANKEIERLINLPQEVKNKFSNKNKDINYQCCPICEKKLFNPIGTYIGTYIFDAEEIISLGHCEYCGIDIDKLDAQFVSFYYTGFDEYKIGNGTLNIERLLVDTLLFSDIHISNELKNKIIQIICLKENIFERFKNAFCYFYIKDLLTELTSLYSDKNYLEYNDEKEDIIENGTIITKSIKEICNFEMFKYYEDLLINKIEKIINLVNDFTICEKKLGEELINFINIEYEIYTNFEYKNWEGIWKNKDVEFDISFNFEYFKEMYEEYIKYIE